MACGSLEPQFYKNLLEGFNNKSYSYKLKQAENWSIFKGLSLNESNEITKELLEMKFKEKSQADWVDIFKNLDACVSPVLELDEAPHHKHNQERKSFIKLPESSDWLPSMNWLENSVEKNLQMPKIGQNTLSILSQLGYSDEQVKEFIKEKIVEADNVEKINSKL